MNTLKKILSLCLVVSLFALAACGSNTTKGEDAASGDGPLLTKIKETGTLTLGTSADYPPYEWVGNIDGKQEVVGFDIALGQAVADELGVKLEVQDMKFDGILLALATGDIDLAAAGLVPTPERQEQVDFSESYYSGGQLILIRKADVDKYKTQDDFQGAKVAAQIGTVQETLALGLQGADVQSLVNLNDMVQELKGQAVDAIVVAEAPGKQFEKLNSDLQLVDLGFPNEDGVALGVAKGNEDFVAIINKVIAQWKQEGKIDEEMAKYTELSSQQAAEVQ